MTPTSHTHKWVPASPIDPEGDPGNVVARIGHDYAKTEGWACTCGASKMILTTNGHRNSYITRANGRLWRGRRRVAGRRGHGHKPTKGAARRLARR